MFDALMLGLLQGLTEFLPVSSSGHLVLFGNWLGTQDGGNSFEVMLHFGTLLSTLVVFRKSLYNLVTGIFQKDPEQIRLMVCIIITTIPTAILGKLFEEPLEKLFSSPLIVSGMLILTGLILFIPKFIQQGQKTPQQLSGRSLFLMGVLQALAIIPGISRSGTTITTGLALGLSRKAAGEYSFLISIPVIMGVPLLKLPALFTDKHYFTIPQMALGTLASFGAGLLALKFLLFFVKQGRLHLFSFYCFAAGILGLFLFK